MPFERYLQADRPAQPPSAPAPAPADYPSHLFDPSAAYPAPVPVDPNPYAHGHHHHRPFSFHVPSFVFGGPPTLAPGGGAEVLPAGLISTPGAVPGPNSWYSNPSYLPKHQDPSWPSHGQVEHGWNNAGALASPQAHALAPSSSSSASASHLVPASFVPPSGPAPSNSQPETGSQASPPAYPPFAWNTTSLSLASPLGLYSTSGFDILSILARVSTRPNPKIVLGPVDMSCSFCVVDVRRYDSPIVYASPTFYRLTGYEEREVLGRNCRFLQSPDGRVTKGEARPHDTANAVAHLRKSLSADKECQASIINFRKDGTAFLNLVTVIPIFGGVSNHPSEADHVAYHVGFQVDLSVQPNAIVDKLRDGSYMVDYSSKLTLPGPTAGLSSRDRRNKAYSLTVSQELQEMLSDASFVSSIAPATASLAPDSLQDWYEGNQPLSMLLLKATTDFVLVLSLKGSFLYIAPAVTRVLGYAPDALIGKSLTDYCHPSDIVPLTRELKESSIPTSQTDAPSADSEGAHLPAPAFAPAHGSPRPVNLLFRARTQSGGYLWLECRGRLHIEPGKGRKAIILSARARSMPFLPWHAIPQAPAQYETEVWGMVSAAGTILSVGTGIKDLLGWTSVDAVGTPVGEFVPDNPRARGALNAALKRMAARTVDAPERVRLPLLTKTGATADTCIAFYPPPRDAPAHTPIVCELRPPSHAAPKALRPGGAGNVFREMETGQGSSWQFELQQLKIENKRLVAEIEQLETEVGTTRTPSAHERSPSVPLQQVQQKQQQQQQQQQTPQVGRYQVQEHPSNMHTMHNWDMSMLMQQQQQQRQAHAHVNPLKRQWDGT